MKLVYTDIKKNRKEIAEADDFGPLVTALVEHKKKMFAYTSGTISLPGKLNPGSAYIVANDPKGGTYTVEA